MPATAIPQCHVIPFDAMTPEQQTDHLMHAHGFDSTYGYELEAATDAAVRAMFLGWTAENRASYHDDDHREYGELECWPSQAHNHDKPSA